MRVLVHALGARTGGAATHLLGLVEALGKHAPQHDFLFLTHKDVQLAANAPNTKVRVISKRICDSFLRRTFFDWFSAPKICKEERIDVVITLTNFGPIWNVPPRLVFQRNPLYFSAGRYHRINPIGARIRIFLQTLLAYLNLITADTVVTPSDAMAEKIRRLPFSARKRIAVLLHAMNPTNVARNEGANTRKGGDDPLILFFPAHLAAHKGLDTLLRSLEKLKKAGLNFNLYVPFDPQDSHPIAHWFWAIARTLGMQSHVIPLGQLTRTQMLSWMRDCDVVVYPTLCESFGFPLLESMAVGAAIVATDLPVNVELCGDKGAAFYAADDVESGASVLKSVLLDAGYRERLGKQAIDRFRSFDWSWRRYAKELVALLEEVAVAEKPALSA